MKQFLLYILAQPGRKCLLSPLKATQHFLHYLCSLPFVELGEQIWIWDVFYSVALEEKMDSCCLWKGRRMLMLLNENNASLYNNSMKSKSLFLRELLGFIFSFYQNCDELALWRNLNTLRGRKQFIARATFHIKVNIISWVSTSSFHLASRSPCCSLSIDKTIAIIHFT